MDVADLKPYVLFCQWPRRIRHNVFEALGSRLAVIVAGKTDESYLQALVVLLLLFIDYPKTEIYLIRLLKVGLHTHHLGEGFLGMLKRSIAII